MYRGTRAGHRLRPVRQMAGTCLLAGVVLAGLLSPVAVGPGFCPTRSADQ